MDPNRRGVKKAPGSQPSRAHEAIRLKRRSEQQEGSSGEGNGTYRLYEISLMRRTHSGDVADRTDKLKCLGGKCDRR